MSSTYFASEIDGHNASILSHGQMRTMCNIAHEKTLPATIAVTVEVASEKEPSTTTRLWNENTIKMRRKRRLGTFQ